MEGQLSPSTGTQSNACGLGPIEKFININVRQAKNGFVVHCGYEDFVAKDKAELLAVLTDYLK